jgi:hypothetical protein
MSLSPGLCFSAAPFLRSGRHQCAAVRLDAPRNHRHSAQETPKANRRQSEPRPQPATSSSDRPTDRNAITADTKGFNAARDNLLPKIGVNTYGLSHQDIEAAPQGANAPLDKVLLQAPGVTLDSAAGGNLHVRNEHANLQYRINGIIIPDGVSGFGQILDTSFVGSLSLITGALPAQYGFRNTGVVDIQTRSGALEPGGSVSMYGGSRGMLTPSIEYGGTSGRTEYFFTGRGFFTDLGLENPTPNVNAIHDHSDQGRAFGYVSTLLDDTTRLTSIAGLSVQKYQIPNNPGQPPQFLPVLGFTDFDSATLDQRQLEKSFYGVVALQKKLQDADLQIAYFTRYSTLHFKPDPIGDLVFNGVASDVFRGSFSMVCKRTALSPEPGAHHSQRLYGEWRVDTAHNQRQHSSTRRRRCFTHRGSSVIRHGCELKAGLAPRPLRPGRVEDHQTVDPEYRHPLRSDVPVCRRQSVQSAGRSGVQARSGHDDPCRLRPLLHAAAAGNCRSHQSRSLRQHPRRRVQRPAARILPTAASC